MLNHVVIIVVGEYELFRRSIVESHQLGGEKIKKQKNKVVLKFLREYMGRKDIFIYPNIPDVESVELKNIIRVLPKPTERRGDFNFGVSVL